MVNERLSQTGQEYETCRYGASRSEFRGPACETDAPFLTVLGGSEAFGRFVAAPFADLLRRDLDAPVLNLTVMHAGLTLLQGDPVILTAAARAEVTVVQVMGAQNMSNPFYTVHPRRNDRFIAASPRLMNMFPEVDFTGFHFTGHLMRTLETVNPWAFDDMLDVLRATWVRQMARVLKALPGRVILLWMSARAAEAPCRGTAAADPAFVDRAMLDALDGAHSGLVEVVASAAARVEPAQSRAAGLMPGPMCHAEVAAALLPVLQKERRRTGVADAPPVMPLPVRASR